MPKFGKFSVYKPKNLPKNLVAQEASLGQKNNSASSIVVKKSAQQAPKFGADPFYKPPSATHLYQNESWVPPLRSYNFVKVWFERVYYIV